MSVYVPATVQELTFNNKKAVLSQLNCTLPQVFYLSSFTIGRRLRLLQLALPVTILKM